MFLVKEILKRQLKLDISMTFIKQDNGIILNKEKDRR